MCWQCEIELFDTLRSVWQWLTRQRQRNNPNQGAREIPRQGHTDVPNVIPSELTSQPSKPVTSTPIMATSSGDAGDSFCTPCAGLGKRVNAEAYCVDCLEFLCGDCAKYHTVLTVTKNHELVSGDRMKEGPPKVRKDKPTQLCKEHEEEVVKYYCPAHDYVGCQVCITLHHRTCKDAVYIQQVSKDILESAEFIEFEGKVKGITDRANKLIAEVGESVETVDECTTDAVKAVRALRKKLNTILDKIEAGLVNKAQQMGKDEKDKMKTLNNKLKPILNEILELTKQIETFKSNQEKSNLFMLMKKSKSGDLHALECRLDEVKGETGVKLFNFRCNPDLMEQLGEAGGVGELRLRIQKLVHCNDINVRADKDSSECSITGSAMMSNCRLVVTDHWNKKIKLIDIRANRLISEFELSSAPWDCSDISDSEVAVSLPTEKSIVLVKTRPELKVCKTINVNAACRGVEHEDGTLIVTFPEQNVIKIMDMDGVVYQTISSDQNGKPLFDNPSYVSIRPDSDVIYVTNWQNNTVVCLETDIHNRDLSENTTRTVSVRGVFTDKELSCPEQVVVDGTGLVYFCGCLSHNIFQASADCRTGKVILTSAEGLRNPYSISYSAKTDRFYVGMRGNRDVVKVYRAT